MEKRLFLAVFLSLAVVFGFQALFPAQKPALNDLSQTIGTKEDTGYKEALSEVADKTELMESDNSFTEEKTVLEEDGMRAEFTNKGGSLERVALVDLKYTFPAKSYSNLALWASKPFKLTFSGDREVVYEYHDADWQVRKTYRINSGRTLSCSVNIKRLANSISNYTLAFDALVVDLSRMDKTELSSDWTLFEYSVASKDKIIRKGSVNNLNEKWNKEQDLAVEWYGFRNRYFATIVKPLFKAENFKIKAHSKTELSVGSTLSLGDLSSGESSQLEFEIYVGPQLPEVLKAADPSFEKIMAFSDWGWLDAIAKGIYWLLKTIHKAVPVWGLCIILVSLIIYGLMYPLTFKSLASMKKMQGLQPKIKELQDKYKKNPEKLNQEIIQLYKTNGVNPLGGCLPMLLQMPIFVGLYQVLWRSYYFRGEKFLWIQDLSMPDRLFKLPVGTPFIEYFNILPIVMIGIMAVQQKLSAKSMVITDPQQAAQQKMMTTIFPVMIGFIFYNFASGLNLYFVVFYLLSAATQWKIAQVK